MSEDVRIIAMSDHGDAHIRRLATHLSSGRGLISGAIEVRVNMMATTIQQIGVFHRPLGAKRSFFSPL